MPGGERDGGFAVLVAGWFRLVLVLFELAAQGFGAVAELLERGPGERQHRTSGDRSDGELPVAGWVGQDLLTEVVAVGESPQSGFCPVRAVADLVYLAVRDEMDGVGRLAGLHEHVPGCVLPLDEPVSQRVEYLDIIEPAQRRQFAEFPRDDAHLGTDVGEGDPAVAHGVAQPSVHPVHTAGHLNPGEHPQ